MEVTVRSACLCSFQERSELKRSAAAEHQGRPGVIITVADPLIWLGKALRFCPAASVSSGSPQNAAQNFQGHIKSCFRASQCGYSLKMTTAMPSCSSLVGGCVNILDIRLAELMERLGLTL